MYLHSHVLMSLFLFVQDIRKAREVAQLRKESRKKEHRIKSLEADAKRREVVLRRRQEEVCIL